MRDNDHCDFCGAVLEAHCNVGTVPEVCDLRETYWTTDMGADEMLEKLYSMVTPEQIEYVHPEVERLMTTGSPVKSYPDPVDKGREMANRWLTHYRYGKD
jgi:hypothetical protein